MGLTAAPRESTIQTSIMKYLRILGIPAIRVNSRALDVLEASGGRRFLRTAYANGQSKGISDILACVKINGVGVFVALEVKRPGEKLTLDQSVFLTWITTAGGIGARVTSCADVEALLQRHGWMR